MEGRKGSEVSRKRPVVSGVLALFVLGAALALVSASSGSTSKTQAAAAKPVVISTGKGFGEVYAAKRSTLAHTLFKATLLPKDKVSRNIALAGLGRADRKVNLALALKCWKNNGCNTGTKGKLTVAYLEQFGENVYRQMSKMEFILQALTYPEVGKIIYSSAHVDFNKAFADWRAAIAQGVDLIVSFPDIGDQYLPVYKEATEAGIPVSTYAWGYATGPGENYTTVVGEDVCVLGQAFAEIINTEVGSGEIAFLGGTPGNPLSQAWQKCEEEALNPEIEVVGKFDTNWQAAGVQEAMASLLASNPDLKGISYEYATGMAQGAFPAFEAAGVTPDQVWTLRTDEVDLGCAANDLGNPNLKIYYYTGGNWQIRQALTAGMMQLNGFEVPPTIVFPIEMQTQSARDLCVSGYPSDVPSSTLVPVDLLTQMYPS